MYDFYEQPYTLIGAAVLVLFGVLTFRSVLPEKRHWWQWLLPLIVAGAGVGLDAMVQTDNEKINAVIDKGIAAAVERDVAALAPIISPDYSDSAHGSKRRLLYYFRQAAAEHQVVSAKKKGVRIVDLSQSAATANVFIRVTFDENSYVAENFKSSVQIKVDVTFEKRPGPGWLIECIELRAIDTQSVSWRHVR